MSWMRECLPERVRILVGFGEGVRTVILRSCWVLSLSFFLMSNFRKKGISFGSYSCLVIDFLQLRFQSYQCACRTLVNVFFAEVFEN